MEETCDQNVRGSPPSSGCPVSSGWTPISRETKTRLKDQEKLQDQETGLNGPEPVLFLMIMIMNLRELETCLSAKNSPCGRKF